MKAVVFAAVCFCIGTATGCQAECESVVAGDVQVDWKGANAGDPVSVSLQQTEPGSLVATTGAGEEIAEVRFEMPGLDAVSFPNSATIVGFQGRPPADDGPTRPFVRITNETGGLLFAGGEFVSRRDPFGLFELASPADDVCSASVGGVLEKRSVAPVSIPGSDSPASALLPGSLTPVQDGTGSPFLVAVIESYFFDREPPPCFGPDCGDGTVVSGSKTRTFIIVDVDD